MKHKDLLFNSYKTAVVILVLSLFFHQSVFGQDPDCIVSKEYGAGYSSSIVSVIDNGDESFTIVLSVKFDDCSGWYCGNLKRFYIEAEADTYSDIQAEIINGPSVNPQIYHGPYLPGLSFHGFKI
jgi:hypothetical protein